MVEKSQQTIIEAIVARGRKRRLAYYTTIYTLNRLVTFLHLSAWMPSHDEQILRILIYIV